MEELTKEELDKKMSFWKIMGRVSIIMVILGIVICLVSRDYNDLLKTETPIMMNNYFNLQTLIGSLDSATPILVPEEIKSVENLKKLANKKLLEIEDSVEVHNYEIQFNEISAKRSFWILYGVLIPFSGLCVLGSLLNTGSNNNFRRYRRELNSREK